MLLAWSSSTAVREMYVEWACGSWNWCNVIGALLLVQGTWANNLGKFNWPRALAALELLERNGNTQIRLYGLYISHCTLSVRQAG